MRNLILLLILGMLTAGVVQADEQKTDLQREALRAQLHDAREQLAEAAARLAELSGELGENAFWYRYTSDNGMLGIGLSRQDEGLTVESVIPDSPAAKAGIETGDIIVAVNGEPVEKASDAEEGFAGGNALPSGLQDLASGETVELTVGRDGETREVEITARPPAEFKWFTDLSLPKFEGFEFPEVEIEMLRKLDELQPAIAPAVAAISLPGFGGRFGELELVALSPELGSYFETEQGILVVSAPEDNELGFKPGDVILGIGGREPNNPAHAFRILRSYGEGETIAVSVLRHGEELTLEHRLQE